MFDIMVNGEKVIVKGAKHLLKGSVGQYYCRVQFDDSWADYERYIIFYFGTLRKSVKIESLSEVIEIPSEMMSEVGYIFIAAAGICGEMQRFTNIYHSLLVVAGSCIEDLDKPYIFIQNYDDYLWLIEYKELSTRLAKQYFESRSEPILGACSAVRKDNLVLGTLDWFYNKQPSFVVRVGRTPWRPKSIGVAGGVPELTDELIRSGKFSLMYDILPFLINSGINEFGVYAKTNVVPMEKNSSGSQPLLSKKDEVSSLALVRYILDNFSTARAAVEFIRDHVAVYFPKNLNEMGYQQHFMVADRTDTFILEFVDNHAVIIEKPYMTNFHLHGVRFNEDGTVLTPETQDGENTAETVNHVTPHGSGLERFNMIVNRCDGLTNEAAMEALAADLRYTNAYDGSENEADPRWLTEFVGGELTVGSSAEDFESVYERAGEIYAERSRDIDVTWQTVHAAIYDLSNLKMTLFSQESDDRFIFNI